MLISRNSLLTIIIFSKVENISNIVVCMQVYVLNPKQDLHGLGYDPFKHAPEFRGI